MLNYKAGLALFTLLFSTWAYGEVDAKECEKQLEKLLLTSVNCNLHIKAEALKKITTVTNGMVKDAACSIPLKFEKAQVYGSWIKTNSVNLPRLQIQCQLDGPQGDTLSVTTFIQPACDLKKGKDWSCLINMSGTQGLGVLGPILETQINENQMLKNEMAKFLTSL